MPSQISSKSVKSTVATGKKKNILAVQIRAGDTINQILGQIIDLICSSKQSATLKCAESRTKLLVGESPVNMQKNQGIQRSEAQSEKRVKTVP